MSDELLSIAEELLSFNEQTLREFLAAAAPPPSGEPAFGSSLSPGTAVLDLVTGEEGIVRARGKQTIILPSAEV